MNKLFFGGVHPADQKRLTTEQGVTWIEAPDQVAVSLRQHIGVACEPIVKVGDYVFMGQKIGDGEGICVPVHASVSGKVMAIQLMAHPDGQMESAIIIENDRQNTWDPAIRPYPSPESISPGELFGRIREAGIVGMGGATFPTEVKAFSSKENIDTLIINGCECEPYITADDMLLRTEPVQVLQGIMLLSKALKPEKTVLAIEDNKGKAIEIISNHLKDFSGITLKVLPTRYPQGAEKQLIKAVAGREVPPGALPVKVGCAVFNVTTAAAVSSAIYEGKPLIHRIVTVTGENIKQPRNFKVPVGISFKALIEAAGGLTSEDTTVIAGGPMMGKVQEDLSVPVVKGIGALLCIPTLEKQENPICIRCGKCLEVCPMHLQPLYLYRFEKVGNMAMLAHYHLADCMECGCCAYTCPGHLPLVEHFRAGKSVLKATESEKQRTKAGQPGTKEGKKL